MLIDYLYALSLLSITITLFYLTRSCFQFKGEIPHQGEEITNRIDKVHGVLDELADIISELGQQSPMEQITQTPNNPILALAQAFLSPKPIPTSDASKTEEERPVYEVEDNQKTQE